MGCGSKPAGRTKEGKGVTPTRQCGTCGQPTTRRPNAKDPWRCLDCSLAAGEAAAIQMSQRQGPAWEKWLQSPGPQGRPRSSGPGPVDRPPGPGPRNPR